MLLNVDLYRQALPYTLAGNQDLGSPQYPQF